MKSTVYAPREKKKDDFQNILVRFTSPFILTLQHLWPLPWWYPQAGGLLYAGTLFPPYAPPPAPPTTLTLQHPWPLPWWYPQVGGLLYAGTLSPPYAPPPAPSAPAVTCRTGCWCPYDQLDPFCHYDECRSLHPEKERKRCWKVTRNEKGCGIWAEEIWHEDLTWLIKSCDPHRK